MVSDISLILPGIVLGLSAGLSPGPLLTLVISETLKHGVGAGVKVAIAPLLTDLPIVAITLLLMSHLAEVRPVFGAIALAGALYLAYLGAESLFFRPAADDLPPETPRSVRKGVVTNFLNPSPYLFWVSIGGPMVIKAWHTGMVPAAGFVGGFYLMLVGAKVLLAIVVGNARSFLNSGAYVITVRLLGLLLFVFAALLCRDALVALGIANGIDNAY